jgi:hypothetical protein
VDDDLKDLEPPKIGRPYALEADAATLKNIRLLGSLQCTTLESAGHLGVAENTFLAFLKREPEARDAYEHGKQSRLVSLRSDQFKQARTNATMAIWLGKQYLGQKDKTEVEHSGSVDVNYARQRLRDRLNGVEVVSPAVTNGTGEGPSVH